MPVKGEEHGAGSVGEERADQRHLRLECGIDQCRQAVPGLNVDRASREIEGAEGNLEGEYEYQTEAQFAQRGRKYRSKTVVGQKRARRPGRDKRRRQPQPKKDAKKSRHPNQRERRRKGEYRRQTQAQYKTRGCPDRQRRTHGSLSEIGNDRDHPDGELHDAFDHPGTEKHQDERRNKQLRNVTERHFLKLCSDLQNTYNQARYQRRSKTGPATSIAFHKSAFMSPKARSPSISPPTQQNAHPK